MGREKVVAGLVQMDSAGLWSDNKKSASELIRRAAAEGASLVILPETADYIGTDFRRHATRIPGPVTDFFQEQAAKYGIYLHCGSMTQKTDSGHMRNTSLVFGPQGELCGYYSKLHLFDVEIEDGPSYRESDEVGSGDRIVLVDTELCTLGLSICYDLRFPELFRLMAGAGAGLLVNCANFTADTGKDHWEPLLRARAIENTCYVAAVGQCGKKPRFRAYGHTMLIDPWGNILGQLGEKPGVLLGEINMNTLGEIRRQIPSLANTREDVYSLKSDKIKVFGEGGH